MRDSAEGMEASTGARLGVRVGTGALEREELEAMLLGGRPRPLRLAVAPLVGAALSVAVFAGLAGLTRYEDRPLTVAGVAHVDEPIEPFVEARAVSWLATEVSLDVGSDMVRLPRRHLGLDVDLAATSRRLRRIRGEGHLGQRLWTWWAEPVAEVPLTVTLDESILGESLRRVALDARVTPIPEGPDGEESRVGLALEYTASLLQLTEELPRGPLVARLPVQRLEPPERFRVAPLRYARFDHVLGEFQTSYARRGDSRGRAMNIELAARLIDGSILQPFEGRFSFNEAVGERSFERGFLPATELGLGGRRVDGVGGGICQVAATLHASALHGGFGVPVHHPHTRGSRYITPGLDAAVSWPAKDLVIVNRYPFHVKIRASTRGGQLRVRLLGPTDAPEVEIETRILEQLPRQTEVELDPELPPGAEVIADEGVDAMTVERVRVIHRRSGPVEERVLLRYPEVTRLVLQGAPETAAVE